MLAGDDISPRGFRGRLARNAGNLRINHENLTAGVMHAPKKGVFEFRPLRQRSCGSFERVPTRSVLKLSIFQLIILAITAAAMVKGIALYLVCQKLEKFE